MLEPCTFISLSSLAKKFCRFFEGFSTPTIFVWTYIIVGQNKQTLLNQYLKLLYILCVRAAVAFGTHLEMKFTKRRSYFHLLPAAMFSSVALANCCHMV